MKQCAVVLSHLSIGYQGKQRAKVVAEDLSAAVKEGELTCLLGENGVGKSTLLRTLAAFQPPLSGSISVRGCKLESLSHHERSRTIGVVLTERPDVQQMTVRELVSLGRQPYTGFWGLLKTDDWQVVDEAIAQVNITELAQRKVITLSDGERQKAMIAKALAQQTPIIYLDEPTAFLDYPAKVDTLLLLRRIAREARKAILLSTHDMELALQVADTVWLMMRHAPLVVGTPHELAAQGVLGRFIERGTGITFDATTLSIQVKG